MALARDVVSVTFADSFDSSNEECLVLKKTIIWNHSMITTKLNPKTSMKKAILVTVI